MKMSEKNKKEMAQGIADETVIRCPVCGKPQVFVQGEISISDQLRFICESPKCRGKNRYISKKHLKNIVDKSNILHVNF